jgi:hypothetical protein
VPVARLSACEERALPISPHIPQRAALAAPRRRRAPPALSAPSGRAVVLLGGPAGSISRPVLNTFISRPVLNTFPGFIPPCLPTKAKEPPRGGAWLHEIKHDGFRIIARKDGDRVRLYTSERLLSFASSRRRRPSRDSCSRCSPMLAQPICSEINFFQESTTEPTA